MPTLSNQVRTTPFSWADSYKLSHHKQYPAGTEVVYSNLTPRKGMRSDVSCVTFFGLQAALLKINEKFENDFFRLSEVDAVNDFKTFYKRFLGTDDEVLYERVRYLHQRGYLPLEVFALPEGARVPYGVPVFAIQNTDPKCFWLTNILETWLSAEIWKAITSATTARKFRQTFDYYAKMTSDQDFMPPFQGHDFSMRGMSGIEDAMVSGAAHAIFFQGSDTCPVLEFIDRYYPNEPLDETLLVTSVPATEHSVVCASGNDKELLTRLLTETYPTGILSYVSDTWDLWSVVTQTLPALKDIIMARDGKLVIRPDSSPKTPYEIICGDSEAPFGSPEYLGLARCLYNIFGGEKNSKGYIQLDSHIGMIYGEAISPVIQEKILAGLKELGFSSTNIVMGIGSYTYQYVTRDTHGLAMKATCIVKNGETIPIFKDPKTDTGAKKSAKGYLNVRFNKDGEYYLEQECESPEGSELELVYLNGGLLQIQTFTEIRATAAGWGY